MRRSEGHRQTPVEPRGQRPVVTPILSTTGLTGIDLLMEFPWHGERETPLSGSLTRGRLSLPATVCTLSLSSGSSHSTGHPVRVLRRQTGEEEASFHS